MPAIPVIHPSFGAGELSPFLYGRVDLAKFHVGARTMLNFFVHPHGGASNRGGTKYVGNVDDHAVRHRLIPFQFRASPAGQNYGLVFGALTMQIVKDGGVVQLPTTTITGATAANPVVITSVAHGMTTGTRVPIASVVGMTELNGNTYTITRINADTYSLGVDGTAYTPYVSGGTAGGGTFTLVSPYASADLALLKFVQSADTMTFTHPGYAPRNLTRTGHAAWTFSTLSFTPTTAAPTGLASAAPGAGPVLVVTALNDSTGEESLPSASAGGTTATDAWSWTAVTGATTYNIYKQKGSIFGFIAQVATNAFTDSTLAPDIGLTPPASFNPFSGGAGEWPACSTYYLQRQVYGDSTNKPQTLWFSNVGGFGNMNKSQPTKDSDAITRTLIGRQVNEIRHLVPGSSLLVMTSGAEWRCWPGPTAAALTPGSCVTLPQTSYGCSHVPPVLAGGNVLFVQERGSRVRELQFDVLQDQFKSKDLTALAQHLLYDTGGQFQIEEWAFAEEPFRIIWGVRSDGLLLGFTYMPEHEVYAWHRHETDGEVESVCSIVEADNGGGFIDAVYLIVNRTIGGATKRYIERMAERVFATIADAWFVDSGLQYDGTNTDDSRTLEIISMTGTYPAGGSVILIAGGFAPFNVGSVGQHYTLRSGTDFVTVTVTTYVAAGQVDATLVEAAPVSLQTVPTADWALSVSSVSGLDHLEGETVAILGDGSVVPSQPVASGAVALDGYYGKVTVGLPYTADLETLNLELPTQGGTVQGQMKKIPKVTLRVKDARGIKVGLNTGALQEIKQRQMETLGSPMLPFNGDFAVTIPSEWNTDGRIFVRQTYPLPCTVLDLIPEVNLGR